MSIKWKFILSGLFLYLAAGFILLQLLEVNKWYFVIGEFLLLISIILFILIYYQLVKPLDTIRLATNLLKEKDFSTRLSSVRQKEIDQLVEVYNKMAEQLHRERVEHEEKNLFLGLLIDATSSAILVLDSQKSISRINKAAYKLFNLKEDVEMPFSFARLPEPWFSKLNNLQAGNSISVRIDGIRQFKASCSSFMDKGFAQPFILIEEMTSELVKAERQSYERVIRMMSHEVNNSVGAVNSVLQSVLAISEQFDENLRQDVSNAISVSVDRNKNLTQFMANFADVVKLPPPKKTDVDLSDLVSKTVKLFETEFEARKIKLLTNLPICPIKADAIQMEQVLMNIVKNSMEAIDREGEINIEIKTQPFTISVIDSGKGFKDETLEKLFTPFFSTKKTGQGIGLTLVREILLNHGFTFKLHRIENNRTEFLIEMEEV